MGLGPIHDGFGAPPAGGPWGQYVFLAAVGVVAWLALRPKWDFVVRLNPDGPTVSGKCPRIPRGEFLEFLGHLPPPAGP